MDITYDQLNKIIQDALNERERANQNQLSRIPSHTHNGTDSAQVDGADLLGFPVSTSIPTDPALEGILRWYYTGTTYNLYARIHQTWVAFPSNNIFTTIILSGAGGWGSTTNGATTNQTELPTNGVNLITLDFAASTKSYAQWTAIMPPNYTGGTITATFYWTANSTSTNSVVWGCQARAYGNAVTINQAFGTAQEITSANTSTAYQLHVSSVTSVITIAGSPTAGQMVQFRVYRLGSGSDNLAATANLIAVKIVY